MRSNKLERFCTCQKHLTSYWKKRDGSSCNDVNAISPITYAVETLRMNILHCNQIDRRQMSTVALVDRQVRRGHVIHSVDNNNTTVGHLCREFSRLLSHFLTHGARRRNKCGRRWHSPLIPGGLKIPCYLMLHGKKLVVRARDIIAGENKTE